MTTQILNLPLLSFSMLVGNNEDWLDSWAYLDASSNPISLAGLTLNFMVRPTASDPNVLVVASTAATVAGLPVNGTITAGGTGGNVVSLGIPSSWMGRVPAGTYVFELQAQGDGDTRTIAAGALTVQQGIVR